MERKSYRGAVSLPRFNSRTVRELLTRTPVVKCIRTVYETRSECMLYLYGSALCYTLVRIEHLRSTVAQEQRATQHVYTSDSSFSVYKLYPVHTPCMLLIACMMYDMHVSVCACVCVCLMVVRLCVCVCAPQNVCLCGTCGWCQLQHVS